MLTLGAYGHQPVVGKVDAPAPPRARPLVEQFPVVPQGVDHKPFKVAGPLFGDP